MSKADYQRHIDYVHYNPVKHGYVARALDWRYSSFHRFLKMGIYPRDWAGSRIPDLESVGME
jgi:putative transposase